MLAPVREKSYKSTNTVYGWIRAKRCCEKIKEKLKEEKKIL